MVFKNCYRQLKKVFPNNYLSHIPINLRDIDAPIIVHVDTYHAADFLS